MRQKSFSSGFEKYHKQTRKEKFLAEMDEVIPWGRLTKEFAPHYPDPQGAGRRPKGLERMLRIYFLQH
jgi:IS5 family transposase